MAPPLIALKDARLAFGATTLFSGLSLALATGERACLVGRNGTGKSTLLKVIAGLQDLDGGERFLQPGTRRSEEHTSELQSLMRHSYAVFCLKKKTQTSN